MRQWLLSITKAFVLLVLATSFLEIWPTDQQFEVIELYAGAARITRLARAIGLSACAHDVTFDDNANSSFNLLGNAGFFAPSNGLGIVILWVYITVWFHHGGPVKIEWSML